MFRKKREHKFFSFLICEGLLKKPFQPRGVTRGATPAGKVGVISCRSLSSEAVEGTALPLQGIDHVHGCDGLPLCVLSVSYSQADMYSILDKLWVLTYKHEIRNSSRPCPN